MFEKWLQLAHQQGQFWRPQASWPRISSARTVVSACGIQLLLLLTPVVETRSNWTSGQRRSQTEIEPRITVGYAQEGTAPAIADAVKCGIIKGPRVVFDNTSVSSHVAVEQVVAVKQVDVDPWSC